MTRNGDVREQFSLGLKMIECGFENYNLGEWRVTGAPQRKAHILNSVLHTPCILLS